MAIYIANRNGDWWEHIPNDDSIWILDTEILTPEQMAIVKEEIEADKFEHIIYEFGSKVEVEVE